MEVEDEGAPSGREPAVAELREQDGAVVVRLAGELDLYNAGEIRSALERASRSEVELIVVDLSAVEFLDSTVLGVLVEARHRAGGTGLRVAAPGRSTKRALELAGVEGYLDVRDSLDDALRA